MVNNKLESVQHDSFLSTLQEKGVKKRHEFATKHLMFKLMVDTKEYYKETYSRERKILNIDYDDMHDLIALFFRYMGDLYFEVENYLKREGVDIDDEEKILKFLKSNKFNDENTWRHYIRSYTQRHSKKFKERKNNRCERCKCLGKLDVHHKKYTKDPDDWELLCRSCHSKEHAKNGTNT